MAGQVAGPNPSCVPSGPPDLRLGWAINPRYHIVGSGGSASVTYVNGF